MCGRWFAGYPARLVGALLHISTPGLLAQEPSLLLSDDFSAGFAQWEVAAGTWTVDHGELVGVGHGGYIDGWIYAGDEAWTDYSLSVKVTFVTGEADFMFRSTGHWDNEYRVLVWSSPTDEGYNVYLKKYADADGDAQGVTLLAIPSPVPITNPVNIQIDIIGGMITCSVNDAIAFTWEDENPLPHGRIALGTIWSGTCRFDDVMVRDLTIPPTIPVIIHEPQSTAVPVGTPAAFEVRTLGEEPVEYQWLRNGVELEDADGIFGSGTRRLQISAVQPDDAGSYTVVVSNVHGSVTSNPANLRVTLSPADSCWLVVFRSADPGRWGTTFGTPGSAEWGLGPEAVPDDISQLRFRRIDTEDSLTIPMTAEQLYACGPVGEGWTWDGTSSWAWNAQHLGISGGDEMAYVGYVITAASCNNNHRSWGFGHRGWIDDRQGWGWDSEDLGPTVFEIAVAPLTDATARPTICLPPRVQSVLAGVTAEFSTRATGVQPLAYEWEFNGIQLSDDDRISGSRSSTLRISAVSSADAGTYTVVVSNVHGSVTSRPATLTVLLRGPEITTKPGGQIVVSGTPVTFTVASTGSLPLTFQWRRNGVDLSDDGRIAGAQTDTLNIAAAGIEDLGAYTVLVQNAYGSVTSLPATLTVILQPPDITSDPMDQTVFSGAPASFSVIATGSLPLEYQWQRNGVDLADGGRISGAQSASLTIAAAEPEDLGLYVVEVQNAYGWTVSYPAQLTVVLAPPTITRQPQGQTLALGSDLTLQVQATGSLPLSYQWQRDGVNVMDGGHISGAATSTLTITDLTLAELGNYSVLVDNTLARIQSTTAAVATFSVMLQIRRDGDHVVISWNETANKFTLQQASRLPASEWGNIVESVQANYIEVPMTRAGEYFRLSYALPAGLVAWWPGDGHARDVVGSNHGYLRNGTGFAPGVMGDGFWFDGIDDVIELPYTVGIKEEMTVDAWVSFMQTENEVAVFGQSHGGPQLRLIWGGRASFGHHDASWNWVQAVSTVGIQMEEFSHLAGTFDGMILRIYVNGALLGEEVMTSPPVMSTCPVWIGGFGDSPGSATCSGSGPQQHLKGVIDEVHVFNRALSANEIKSIYEGGRGGLAVPAR